MSGQPDQPPQFRHVPLQRGRFGVYKGCLPRMREQLAGMRAICLAVIVIVETLLAPATGTGDKPLEVGQ